MSGPTDNRAAQIAVMAHPDRLQLLSLILAHPSGGPEITALVGPDGDARRIESHLAAMIGAGLLVATGPSGARAVRPTADALARFGGAAIGNREGGLTGSAPLSSEHAGLLDRITAELSARFADVFAVETVAQFVRDSYDMLARRATVRQHLPALASRFAVERLTALAKDWSVPAHARPVDVLFVCVRNAGRSQIAAVLLRSLGGERVHVRSAGSAPAATLDPAVRNELARRGLDALTEFPRPLTDEVVRASDVVVTMGCGDACPVLPGRRYLDWAVPDPLGRPPHEVAMIVDDIAARVSALVREISG